MDGDRFDALARALTAIGSRRRALGALGGALGSLGLAHPNEAPAKKKKPCPPCRWRKKGKCKKTFPDGAACRGGTCQGGRCITALAPSPVCPVPCPSCRICNPATGQCDVCPANCDYCFMLTDGSTASQSCTTASDCLPTDPHCVASVRVVETTQPLDWCGGAPCCTAIEPCA